ncbi:MAG TPA: phenylalanine--tRNA ligase subunit alpha [Candidatus Krumholzibacteria bacterium]|nr:phenylalanine--tRNA ligase subunit alpha [Candidatus Krumholzibacteria bacterium]HRX50722.1 phenylalanine--tRNA ligase subunit alpha [Candidatus Krumholzibacteria bacterium]
MPGIDLDGLRREGLAHIEQAGNLEELARARAELLGRKGRLTTELRGLKDVSAEERPALGAGLNTLREELEAAFEARKDQLTAAADAAVIAGADLTLPAVAPVRPGGLHPLPSIIEEICDIFRGLGFSRADGPDVELDYYNFTALNFPDDHPARDIQDTFYIDGKRLLRTQTSPVQVRVMERHAPPLAVVIPGRVYRNEAVDASHAAEFFQIEGLYVDKDVSLVDLRATVREFIDRLYGAGTEIRFRPHFFPFTEPSVEVDMGCFVCKGEGCNVCGRTGWIEIMGAGMVHPNVFKAAGYDPDAYTGFAFGLGIDRIAMLRYGIDDIRLLYENDLRFLQQFRGVR